MSAIHFEQVSRLFPGATVPAVDNCTLEVPAKSFVVILGPSGCGKTTLLKMVNRLYEPTSGHIFLDGADVRSLEVTALRRRIGYVIQQGGLFPHLTVARNVGVVPELLDWPKERIAARVRELLSLVELDPDEYQERYPAQLSGGQQQRVGLARALAGDPQVILMDEPFGAIDAITRGTLQEAVLKLQRRLHKTVLFVTHDVEEALRLADRIVVMRAGRVVQYDTPFELLAHPVDEFVSSLLGAEDVVRRLSLVRVETAMAHDFAQPEESPTVALGENLRQALSVMLRTGAVQVIVIDGDRPTGIVTLEQIRLAAQGMGAGLPELV